MKKVEAKMINTRKQQLKWSFRQTFKREKQCPNGAIATEKEKMNKSYKPIYIRETILECKVNVMSVRY